MPDTSRQVGGMDKRCGIGLSNVQWMLLAAFARAGATEEKHGQASPHTPLFIRDPFNATLVQVTRILSCDESLDICRRIAA